MALYGQGFSLRSLLENPNLQNPPNLNKGSTDHKKIGKFGGYVPNVNSAFLGSNLWDKPSNDNSSSNDFDLEYMDLDEFLSENGIPVNPADNDDSQTISLLASALARSPCRSPNPGSPGLLIDPISPGNPQSIPVGDDLDKLGGFSNMSSPVRPPSSPLGHVIVSPRILTSKIEGPSHSVIERYLMDDNFGVKLPSSKTDNNPDGKESGKKRKMSGAEYKVTPEDVPVVTMPVYQQNNSPIQYGQMVPSPGWESNDDDTCSNDGEECINNMIPGQDGFDPTARKFTTEELKPQPIIKKARKIFVDDVSKDDKYWQRRKKNNVAAKRSREARRIKENQIAMRASFLESENDKLRVSYEKIKRENESLMKRLSKYE